MRNKYICDLCQTEITESSWVDCPSDFKLTSYCASQNPLGALGYGYQRAEVLIAEVCQRCQRSLAKAVAERLTELSLKKTNQEVLS